MDAITRHHHTVIGPWEAKGRATGFDETTWAKTMQSVLEGTEQHIARTINTMDRHDPKRRIALFVDEWGMWHDPEPGTNGAFLQQQNTLRDAMVAALSFDVFHRHTDCVKMANIAQMVNVLQAMILTNGPRMVLTPTCHVLTSTSPSRCDPAGHDDRHTPLSGRQDRLARRRRFRRSRRGRLDGDRARQPRPEPCRARHHQPRPGRHRPHPDGGCHGRTTPSTAPTVSCWHRSWQPSRKAGPLWNCLRRRSLSFRSG